MGFTASPNMSLLLPTIGEELSPTWAQDLNSSLSLIDQHDHSPGAGVQISPAGININTDLPFNNHNLTLIRSARFNPQSSPINLGTDVGCVYVAGVDLYFNDVNGNQIQLTQGGSIAGTSGSITNLVSPAAVIYVPATPAFVFQSAALTSADLDAGSITLRNNTPSSFGIMINAPVALGANYSLTLPPSLPGSTLPLSVSNSGNISAGQITTPQITDLAVTTAKIDDGAVTSAKLDTDLTITGTFEADHLIADTDVLIDSTVLLSKNVSSLLINAGIQLVNSSRAILGSYGDDRTLTVDNGVVPSSAPIVVSAAGASHGELIVRGIVAANGTVASGVGFSSSQTGTGTYSVTFTTPYLDIPAVVTTAVLASPGANIFVTAITTNGFIVEARAGALINTTFSFIASGLRGV